MSYDIEMLPYYSLSPNQIVLFERPDINNRTNKQIETQKNLLNNENKYNELSEHSRKRLKKAINNMLYLAKEKTIQGNQLKQKEMKEEIIKINGKTYKNKIKYKLTFITLTLSSKQEHSDEEIKSKLLNHFLVTAKKKWKIEMYIWKAEKQENENIHFHILTDKYIPHEQIKEVWNKIQNKKGFNYVDKYSQKMQAFFKNGFKPLPNDPRSKEQQLKAYKKNKNHNWTKPNSTDIHALYSIKNLAAYMSKYLTKGVTKTERINKINILYNQKEQINQKLTEIDKSFESNPQIDTQIKLLEQRKIEIDTEVLELLKQGISGRIWGQSQKLSKITNFVDLQHPSTIPNINLVKKNAKYAKTLDIGKQQVYIYAFDMKKTPELKKIYDDHINNCLTK